MKLLYRIVAAPLFAVSCLLAAGGLATYAIDGMASRFATLRDDKLSAARVLAEVESRMANVNALLYRTVTIIDSLDATALEAVRRRIQGDTDHAMASLRALEGKVDAAIAGRPKVVAEDLGKYKDRALQAVAMAETSVGAAATMLSSADASFKKSAADLHEVSDAVNADVDALSVDVVSLATRTRTWLAVLSVAAAAASMGMAWRIARRFERDLARAVAISEAVAAGRLDVDVPQGGPDEVGRLLDSLRNTVHRLSESLGLIQQATGSLHTASSEIAAGSQDLSARTERAASHLQQTTGSVAMLGTAVDEGAHAARDASALAASAADVASRGGGLVKQVVATMQDLHASSREIGSIIGTIDGIAFQTNILALNAAVEAARAGEHGRGFAVVASEVRALAQRAADAARQIKSLVGASVDKAEEGSRLVGEAGLTMSELVSAVERVDAMVSGIAARSSQQNQGIAEVNHAVADLDQMTQQNAALVEQSAAAAESLKQHAANLAQIVGAFRFRS